MPDTSRPPGDAAPPPARRRLVAWIGVAAAIATAGSGGILDPAYAAEPRHGLPITTRLVLGNGGLPVALPPYMHQEVLDRLGLGHLLEVSPGVYTFENAPPGATVNAADLPHLYEGAVATDAQGAGGGLSNPGRTTSGASSGGGSQVNPSGGKSDTGTGVDEFSLWILGAGFTPACSGILCPSDITAVYGNVNPNPPHGGDAQLRTTPDKNGFISLRVSAEAGPMATLTRIIDIVDGWRGDQRLSPGDRATFLARVRAILNALPFDFNGQAHLDFTLGFAWNQTSGARTIRDVSVTARVEGNAGTNTWNILKRAYAYGAWVRNGGNWSEAWASAGRAFGSDGGVAEVDASSSPSASSVNGDPIIQVIEMGDLTSDTSDTSDTSSVDDQRIIRVIEQGEIDVDATSEQTADDQGMMQVMEAQCAGAVAGPGAAGSPSSVSSQEADAITPGAGTVHTVTPYRPISGTATATADGSVSLNIPAGPVAEAFFAAAGSRPSLRLEFAAQINQHLTDLAAANPTLLGALQRGIPWTLKSVSGWGFANANVSVGARVKQNGNWGGQGAVGFDYGTAVAFTPSFPTIPGYGRITAKAVWVNGQRHYARVNR